MNNPLPQDPNFCRGGILSSNNFIHPELSNDTQRMTSTKQMKWNAVKREMTNNVHNKERLSRLKLLLRETENSGAYELCRPILNNIIELEIKMLVSDSIIEY